MVWWLSFWELVILLFFLCLRFVMARKLAIHSCCYQKKLTCILSIVYECSIDVYAQLISKDLHPGVQVLLVAVGRTPRPLMSKGSRCVLSLHMTDTEVVATGPEKGAALFWPGLGSTGNSRAKENHASTTVYQLQQATHQGCHVQTSSTTLFSPRKTKALLWSMQRIMCLFLAPKDTPFPTKVQSTFKPNHFQQKLSPLSNQILMLVWLSSLNLQKFTPFLSWLLERKRIPFISRERFLNQYHVPSIRYEQYQGVVMGFSLTLCPSHGSDGLGWPIRFWASYVPVFLSSLLCSYLS